MLGASCLLPGRACRPAVPGSEGGFAASPLFCSPATGSATQGSPSHPALGGCSWCPPPNPPALCSQCQRPAKTGAAPSALAAQENTMHKELRRAFALLGRGQMPAVPRGAAAHPAPPQRSALCRSPACITVTKPQGRAVPVVRDTAKALPAPELSLGSWGLHVGPGSFS